VPQSLPLQIALERFQHISFNYFYFAKIEASHSMCGPG